MKQATYEIDPESAKKMDCPCLFVAQSQASHWSHKGRSLKRKKDKIGIHTTKKIEQKL